VSVVLAQRLGAGVQRLSRECRAGCTVTPTGGFGFLGFGIWFLGFGARQSLLDGAGSSTDSTRSLFLLLAPGRAIAIIIIISGSCLLRDHSMDRRPPPLSLSNCSLLQHNTCTCLLLGIQLTDSLPSSSCSCSCFPLPTTPPSLLRSLCPRRALAVPSPCLTSVLPIHHGHGYTDVCAGHARRPRCHLSPPNHPATCSRCSHSRSRSRSRNRANIGASWHGRAIFRLPDYDMHMQTIPDRLGTQVSPRPARNRSVQCTSPPGPKSSSDVCKSSSGNATSPRTLLGELKRRFCDNCDACDAFPEVKLAKHGAFLSFNGNRSADGVRLGAFFSELDP
jgi:hypothetical protein